MRFQRRFTVVDGATDDGRDILRFVFDRVPKSIDELPQRTTLERAIVSHLRGGGHWKTRTGWLVPSEDRDGLRVGEIDVLRVVGVACERRDRFAGVDTRQQRRKQRVVMAEHDLAGLQQLDLTDEELRERALMGLAIDVGSAGEGDQGDVGTEVAEDARSSSPSWR